MEMIEEAGIGKPGRGWRGCCARLNALKGRGALAAAFFLLAAFLTAPALAAPVKLAAGTLHSVALHNDGTVWTWGDNHSGQLGNGTTNSSANPARVPGLSGVVSVAADGLFTAVLKNDGTVWAWGDNSGGQLGNGTRIASAVPVRASGVSGVVSIGVGDGHVVALRSDGSLWAWGRNGQGQFGNGSTDDSLVPIQVQGPNSGITAVDGGVEHTIALKNDGSVWCWGANDYGQLGTGATSYTPSTVPVMVPGLAGISAVAAAPRSNFALKNDGTLWSWGYNANGELGNGTTGGAAAPLRVSGLPGPVALLAPGSYHTAVLLADGSIWSWGYNWPVNGLREAYSYLPQRIAPEVSETTALASGYGFILALGKDGNITAWGQNQHGELGAGAPSYRVAPIQVPGISSVAAVSSCSSCSHILALKSDGTVWAWGGNTSDGSALGNGSSYPSSVPVQAVGLTGVRGVAAGRHFSLAVRNDGTVWSWGFNGWGQLGTGGATSSSVPVQVAALTGVTRVAAGERFSLALKNDGTVWVWGSFSLGGFSNMTPTPVQIPGLSGVVDVAAGDGHGMALKGDGSVWVWGGHGYGDTWDTSLVQVVPLEMATRLAGGSSHSMTLIKDTRQVFLWGSNSDGELCNGTTTPSSTPGAGFRLSAMQDIAAGSSFSLALADDGTVWACGRNDYGQLGNGSTSSAAHSSRALQLADMIDVAAGERYSVALKADGTVWAWGQNDVGQLGINTGRQPLAALVNLGPQEATLTVSLTGNGQGSVHSTPAGIACSAGTCSAAFPYGAPVTLHPTSSTGSVFAGWSGACSGTADCLLSMTSARSVSAAFTIGPSLRIGSTGYSTLAAAYAAAPSGATILAREGDLLEGLLAERNVIVKLVGGYYTNFSGRSGLPTRLRGKVLLRRGTVKVDGIKVM